MENPEPTIEAESVLDAGPELDQVRREDRRGFRGFVRRHLLALLATGLLAFAVMGFLTNRWFVTPTLDTPVSADAIAVLAGGGADRDNLGVHYLATGVADTILFSNPGQGDRRFNANQYCNSEKGLRLPRGEQICYSPEPSTTRGEIREIARLATANGWDHLVLVTSVDQATRARRLMQRCFDGTVEIVAVAHDQSILRRAPYEWGAGIKATILRSC